MVNDDQSVRTYVGESERAEQAASIKFFPLEYKKINFSFLKEGFVFSLNYMAFVSLLSSILLPSFFPNHYSENKRRKKNVKINGFFHSRSLPSSYDY
jgi:hypothetical protein